MFSLIIFIISIALVAALALATFYYGGDAFSAGSSNAKAAEAINGAMQITGADQLQRAQMGSGASLLGELVANGYLSAIPAGEWVFAGGQAIRTDLSEDVCLAALALELPALKASPP